MSLDLNDLLQEWPHEPGMIKVRKVTGNDGRERVQLRIDLGVLQMELDGRPDGLQPNGCESLLEYHREKAQEAQQRSESYTLSPEEIGALQQEGVQYYHRYISLFQLEDFKRVIRDTKRNLEMFEFVSQHSPDDELAWSVEQFTPYVLMMNARAKASVALDIGDRRGAAQLVEKALGKIRAFYGDCGEPELLEHSPEVEFLEEWLEELKRMEPLTELQQMRQEMERAIASEAYERAAELRDAIRALENSK